MTASFPIPRSTRALWLALVAAAAACDGADPSHEGPQHATLAGQLHPAETGAADGPLRVAVAWYPGLLSQDGEPISQPGAIHTQDVSYDGALPQAYTFDLREAPPAAALRPMPEGWTGRGAVGILLAYQDRNANGRLDPIPADGAPIDGVVGASLEWTAAPAFVVAYLTDDQPAGTGLRAGFNLLRIADAETTEVVPLGTPIPIAVSQGGALLDLFVCEAAWDGSSPELPCGLDLGEGPVEVVLDAAVEGEVYATDDSGAAAFELVERVDGLPVPISDATVTLGGAELPFDAESGFYLSRTLGPAMFAEEGTVELVATRGEAVLRREIAIPAFELTGVPATVESGSAFDLSWSGAASADFFNLYLFADPTSFFVNASGLGDPSYHVTPIDHVGGATLTVAALSPGEISVTVVRSTTLTFVAAAQAIAAR